jgi:hypothetical protein
MSYTLGEMTDQNWQRNSKFSLLGYLKYLGFRALHLALVGRRRTSATAVSVPVLSETPGEPPHCLNRR